jgi:hypothetical protein
MGLTVDTSVAERRLKRAKQTIEMGATAATKRGAEVIKRQLVQSLPSRTGKMRQSLRVKRLGKRWFATIPRSSFGPRIFYPILYSRQIRQIVGRSSTRAKSAAKTGFKSAVRGKL